MGVLIINHGNNMDIFYENKDMDAKEYGKLAKVIRRGYVRVVEVTSLNH